MARRIRNASVRSFVSKSKIAGSVIGGSLGIKTIWCLEGGFSLITFFLSSDLNEILIYFRLYIYITACRSSGSWLGYEGGFCWGTGFEILRFLKKRRENKGKMFFQPAVFFELSECFWRSPGWRFTASAKFCGSGDCFSIITFFLSFV